MFRKLIGFESLLQTRQVGFWVACAAMFIISALVLSSDVFSVSITTGEKVKANGSITLAVQTGIFNLGAIFFGAVFVVNGVMRDETHKMLEIVHATPVSTMSMTGSRIFGAFLATYFCVFAGSLGLFAGQFAPWLDKESIGPINVVNFLYPAIVFTFINALFVTAFFTLIAGLTRNRTLVYVSAVGLFMLYFATGIIVGEDPPDWIGALSDPFGVNALAIETEFWPAAEQNDRALPVWGWVGANRLLWAAISFGLLGAVFSKFKRGLVNRKIKPSKADKVDLTVPASMAPVTPSTGFRADCVTFLQRLKFEFSTTVRSVAFIILVTLALTFFAIALGSALYLSPQKLRPTSMSMIQIAFGSLAVPMAIIIVFFAGEMIWRDRVAGIHKILDASPARNWPFLAGKWVGLMLVLLTILTVGMIFTMIVQLFVSDISVNVLTYLKFTYMSFVPNILALTVLALFVQNFLPNRVLGMLVSAGVLIFVSFFMGQLPFYHPLMGFGAGGTGALSEMNGYNNLLGFKWFNIYWGSFCALLAIFSLWIWRRGLQVDLLSRLKSIPAAISSRTGLAAALMGLVFVGSGGFIFKAYNIDNDYYNRKASEKRTVEREKLFETEFKLKIPKIQSVEVDVDFKPSIQEARVKGKFVIKNVHETEISELYINPPTRHPEEVLQLDIAGATRIMAGVNNDETPITNADGDTIESIEDYNYYLYRFEPALAPGAETTIVFDTTYHAPKLNDGSIMVRNGTFVNNQAIMPQMGIQDRRMRDSDKRRKYDLDKLPERADRTDMETRQYNFFTKEGDYVDFKSKMCTDLDQIAISPGKLIREYTENGQSCRDYEAINPIINFFSFVSAKYEFKKDVWKNPDGRDVEIIIYHDAKHHYNVDLMIDAIKTSFDVYTKLYGPYKYHQMRVLEIPYIGFAQAFAGTVPFSEGGFLLDPGKKDDPKSIDRATFVTMHEVGHQWFGHQIVPADVKGFNILSEGLTENASTTAYQEKYGWQKARQKVEKNSMDVYLATRAVSSEKEASLALAEEQSYLFYQKADWVFWGLRHYLGADALQGGVKNFVDEYGSKGPPYPTTLELIKHLRAIAAPDYQGLITDYWDRITFWKLSYGDADITVEGNDTDGFTVTLPVSVDKLIADEKSGKETSVSEIDGEELSEWVEIGFYTQDPKETLGDEWLSLERINLSEAETELSFTMKERPTHVLLDPRRLLIERNVKDNVKELKD